LASIPRVAGSSGIRKKVLQPSQEIVPALVSSEDFSPFYPQDDHVVQNTRGIKACLSRHAGLYTKKAHKRQVI